MASFHACALVIAFAYLTIMLKHTAADPAGYQGECRAQRLLPDKQDPHWYWVCSDGGKATPFRCQGDMVWNRDTEQCTQP
ncbi:hypothetical protein B0O80DRAFT_454989 [Mortierella sp. GBAus27b]|nr:hypothetical protein B0O80DRAFT_454989 [Mortierella sp. GBAus27b]